MKVRIRLRVQLQHVQSARVPLEAQTVTQPPLGAPEPELLVLLSSLVDCFLASPADWEEEFPDSAHSTDSAIEMLPRIS
jgi:hypothetical protein